MSPASSHIWDIVCGFPEPTRSNRPLFMLTAFVDDSGIGQWPISVMAGFIAPAEKWAAFSDEWQQVLDMRPSLHYLKMNEAKARNGEFAHWGEKQRDERLALFFTLIERYATIGITSAVPLDLYRSVFRGRVSKELRYMEHPYFLLFFGVVHCIALHFSQAGHRDPIDFVFDNQPDQVKRIIEAWEGLTKYGTDEIKPLVAKPPIFRDDKLTLPLQAADLHAWWSRRNIESALLGTPELSPPFPDNRTSLDVPIMTMFWKKDALKRMRKSLTPYLTMGPMKISGHFPYSYEA